MITHPRQTLLFSSAARPLRFAGTGGIAGATQLLLLALLTHEGWSALPANGIAFLLAAQVNFILSSTITWGDRAGRGSILRRWLLFHGSIAATALLNMLVFAATRTILPTLAASGAGIIVAALANYLLGDRLVFRGGTPATIACASSPSPATSATRSPSPPGSITLAAGR